MAVVDPQENPTGRLLQLSDTLEKLGHESDAESIRECVEVIRDESKV